MEHYLQLFINHHQLDWNKWLPTAKFAYNDKVHSSTKVTPFFADMGRHPYKGTAPKKQSENPSAQQFVDNMWKTQDEVSSALKKAARDMTRYYDRKHRKSYEYKVSDQAWLEGTNISTDQPMKKLGDKRFGPFKVIKKVGASSYQLESPKHGETSTKSSTKYSLPHTLSPPSLINPNSHDLHLL